MTTASSSTSSTTTAWEGLGGPISRPEMMMMKGTMDPTLDACCKRDAEEHAKAMALRHTLQTHDRIAAYERARRNLVSTQEFAGCRCCYDPNQDGTGEYATLATLRAMLQLSAHHEYGQPTTVDTTHVDKDDSSEPSDDEYDYLLDDHHDDMGHETTKAWETQRRAEMEDAVLKHQLALQHGYGAHRQLHPTRILKAAGLGSRSTTATAARVVVIHLVDPDAMESAWLDVCLEKLAEQYRGTKFMRSGGRSTLLMNQELVEMTLRIQAKDIPALIAVRDGVVVQVAPRLGGLVNGDTVMEDEVQHWLERANVLLANSPPIHDLCGIRPEEGALLDSLARGSAPTDCFDCGVPDCQKTYPHEHVGVQTDVQSGLVLSEEDILECRD